MTTRRTRGSRSGGLLRAFYTLVRPATFESRPPSQVGLRYESGSRGGVAPLCDVYLPDPHAFGGPHPSVIVVHGGGFIVGHRRMKPVRLVAARLCEQGLAVCSVDYSLLFRGGGLDAQLRDVGAAAEFWRDEAELFGCDADRISLMGFSAGASIILLHAGWSEHAYHRIVSLYGVTDFDRVPGRSAGLLLRLVLDTHDRKDWRKRSPMSHAMMPTPLLLIHGTDDDLVPVEHSVRLHEARVVRGLPSELELVEGMGHGFVNDASLPETTRAVSRAVAFIRA